MSADPLGEIVFQHEGVCRPLLAKEIISEVHDEVSLGTADMLRAGGCREGRRTGGRRKHVGR
jgi:hypothetical protein